MKEITRKKVLIIIAVCSILFVWIFGTLIYTMIDDRVTSSKILFPEYHNLFTKEAQKKLQLLTTTKSRNREPRASYVYDGRFNLFVFKVVLSSDNNLKNVIDYQKESSHIYMNAVYSELPSFKFDMKLKAGKSVLVSTVHFKCDDVAIKPIIQKDNIYCYYYKFKTFSISYNDEPYDIIAKADKSNVPASLLFLRKGKSLYIIIMTITEGKEGMEPDELSRIICCP